jgi:hypothetical protein
MIVYRSVLATRDPAHRARLVRFFARDQLTFLLAQIADESEPLTPESIAQALRDVASVLLLPPAGEALTPPLIDPTDHPPTD